MNEPSATSASTGVVLRRATVSAWTRAQRAAGKRIVLTNGVFDLLHVGHVRMLNDAAKHGDVLLVAVNGDAHVRRTRGAGRPQVPAHERVEVVASLGAVSAAFVFDDATVDALLDELRPDVHAKGKDYNLATLPERQTNARLGIAMVFVGDEKRHSSTALALPVRPTTQHDRILDRSSGTWTAYVHDDALPVLARTGWASWDRWAETEDGEHVEGEGRRVVHRLTLESTVVYLKRTRPLDRRRSPLMEFQHTLAVRAAGFGAPKPWLCFEGVSNGKRMGALVTEAAPGTALDVWLHKSNGGEGVHGARVARGLGRYIRGLHTARLFPRDLQAWHIFVDDDDSRLPPSFSTIDLMRLERGAPRVSRRQAVKGLAPLALSIEALACPAFRRGILRGYLGGSLKSARPWIRNVRKRMDRLRERGSFQPPALKKQLDANRARAEGTA